MQVSAELNPLLLECLVDIQDTLQEDLNAGGCNADTEQKEWGMKIENCDM